MYSPLVTLYSTLATIQLTVTAEQGHKQSRDLKQLLVSCLQGRRIRPFQREPPTLIDCRQSPCDIIMEPRIHDDHDGDDRRQDEQAFIQERVALDLAVDVRADQVLLCLVIAVERCEVQVRGCQIDVDIARVGFENVCGG